MVRDSRILLRRMLSHQVTPSADRTYFVDAYSRADMPYTSVVRRASDGKVIAQLEKSDTQ